MTFDYCPDDGAEMELTEDGLAERASCPECGRVSRRGLLDWVLFRLPPRARRGVERGLQALLERPQNAPVVSALRALALSTLGIGILGSLTADRIAWLAGVVIFFASLMLQARFDADSEPTGDVVSSVDGALLVLVLAINQSTTLSLASALVAMVPTTLQIQLPPAGELLLDIGLWVLLVAGVGVGSSAGTIVHERCHWVAFRLVGVQSRIEYETIRVVGVPVQIYGAETLPTPYGWQGERWESALVGAAPLVMWIPVLAVWLGPLSLPAFKTLGAAGAFLAGTTIAWPITALPSGGDLAAIGDSRNRWGFEVLSGLADHRLAEGYDTERETA